MKSTLNHILKTAGYTTAACVLTVAMAMGNASAARDIPAAADFLKQTAMITGDANTGDLRLNDQINRAELMKILVNAAANTVDTFEFRDCLADINAEWFARYVCWAYANNYVAGYPDGAFHAGRAVNHAEALKLISEVFHLDYQRMAPVADDSIWYDIYLRNAQRQRIIDAPMTAEDLAKPATRGEVFDYLFRAMAISQGTSDTFTDERYKSYPQEFTAAKALEAQPRALTPAETALIKTLRAQLSYGYQPMSGTGSTMLKFGGSGMGMTFDLRADVATETKMDGTKDTMKGFNEEMQLVLDVKSTGDDTVAFKATADVALAGSGTSMLYAKLDNLEVLDIQAPIEAKIALNEAVAQVDTIKGIWYSFDLAGLEEGIPLESSAGMYEAIGTVAVDFLEKSLKASSAPYFDVILADEGNQATILVKPSADRIGAMIEQVVLNMNPSMNRYMVRQTERTFASALNMFANNMSILLTYDKNDWLVRKFAAILDPVTVEVPEERTKLTLEFASEEYYNYDKDFELNIPATAVDIKTLWEMPEDEARPETASGATMQ